MLYDCVACNISTHIYSMLNPRFVMFSLRLAAFFSVLGLVAQVFGVIKVDMMLIVVELLMLGVWMQYEREKSNNKK
ncbi:hypothetical protein LT23_04631 [Klebsiella pneumoniae]|nr:hypothetical protein LT23_04631 [Klebsiella pneumoniae]